MRENLRATREEAKERIQAHREELKEKLVELQDEAKKRTIERIDSRIETVNTKQTDHLNQYLEKMFELLEKLTARAASARERGVDTTNVDGAIATAKASIASAQAAVTAQTGKTYEIAIDSEETASEVVRSVHQGFKSDMETVRDAVRAAHEAVRVAIKSLGAAISSSQGE